MPEDFNLYPLHVFRLVARLGSVTQAAKELFISQPAVSAHLRALEEHYSESLFERTPKGMLLTPAGAALVEQTNKLFALYEELPSVIASVRGQVQGEVIVGASSTPGAYFLPGVLKRFQEKYPAVRPTLVVGDSAQVLEWLREYRIPLGIIGEMSMTEDLDRLEIGADELQLVAAADDQLCRSKQVRPQHLSGRTLFLREPGSSTRAATEALLRDLLPAVGRVVEIESTEAIKQSVIAGLGIAVLSSWATKFEESAGLLRPVRDSLLRQQRKFYLVKHKNRNLTATAAALWDCLSTAPAAIFSMTKRRKNQQ